MEAGLQMAELTGRGTSFTASLSYRKVNGTWDTVARSPFEYLARLRPRLTGFDLRCGWYPSSISSTGTALIRQASAGGPEKGQIFLRPHLESWGSRGRNRMSGLCGLRNVSSAESNMASGRTTTCQMTNAL